MKMRLPCLKNLGTEAILVAHSHKQTYGYIRKKKRIPQRQVTHLKVDQ